MRIAVVVLGDVGRSPRMQYHALALAVNRIEVDLIGYAGTLAPREIENHGSIHIHRLPAPSALDPAGSRQLFLVVAAFRALRQTIQLFQWLVWTIPRPDVILVQTPPAVPTLLVAWLAARARSARFVIDWHNFGYAVLALRLGRDHVVVRMAAQYERFLARRADAHLAVSAAMQREIESWRVGPVSVFYDRPAARFTRPTPGDRAQSRQELLAAIGAQPRSTPSMTPAPSATPATSATSTTAAAIVITTTSWTADEDFDVLIDAVTRYDAQVPARDLIVVVTGQGPRRATYERRFAAMTLTHVRLQTLWIEPDAFPRLLAAADAGLCLHRSASGVDLPMKLADFRGAGLPVFALDYGPCLRERIVSPRDGVLFLDAGALAESLAQWFGPTTTGAWSPPDAPRDAEDAGGGNWQDGWEREARAHILGS